MWLYILSLLGIFLENSIFFTGEKVFFITIPFFTYVLLKKRGDGVFSLLIILVLVALQGDRYLYFFMYFLFYSCLCYFLLRQMEYNQGSIFYITILELFFYILLQYPNWNLWYLGMHGIVFLGMNYIYLKDCYRE